MDYITNDGVALSGTCLAMGNFDGLHRGHRAVLDKLVGVAAERALKPVLFSFDRDEAKTGPKCLTTEAEKRLLLEKSGIEAMVSLKVDGLGAAAQVRYAVERLGAKVLVIGENDSRLEQLKEGIKASGCDLITCGVVEEAGEAITAERAARALEACDFPALLRLLGRPYFIYGEVVYGKQLGRTVGMPTANVSYAPNKHLPPDGVYGTITLVEGTPHKGMANIGRRPTVDNFDYVTVENFLLDFSRNLYGQFLRMDIHAQIRGVMKFKDLEELKVQVEKDIQAVRFSLEQSLKDYYTPA
ncbi:MAG: riboflavin kinase [Bacillota bacterium]